MEQEKVIVLLREYHDQTIKEIRKREKPELNRLSNEKIERLYNQWSEDRFSASWIMYCDEIIDEFVEWATTAPCNR